MSGRSRKTGLGGVGRSRKTGVDGVGGVENSRFLYPRGRDVLKIVVVRMNCHG